MNLRSIILASLCLIIVFSYFTIGQIKNPTEPQSSQVLSTLRTEFQRKNKLISYVEITDIRPAFTYPITDIFRPNRYLVMARGIRRDQQFQGNFEDELFGIFLLDDSLFHILRTVDIIPTQRWGDYAVRVVKITKDTLTIHGEGTSYGDQPLDKKLLS